MHRQESETAKTLQTQTVRLATTTGKFGDVTLCAREYQIVAKRYSHHFNSWLD